MCEDNDTSVQSQHPLVGESGNEGGSMRTIVGWDFHEMNKLFIVPDAPP